MGGKGKKAQVKGKCPSVENPSSASATTGGKAQVKRKHPCEVLAGSSSSASATAASGTKAQVKGKRPSVENPSSASTTTDMVVDEKDYVAKRLEFVRSIFPEDTDDTEEAPKSPYFVDASEYPPGAVIETVHVWEGGRFVAKVPRWAREEMRHMFPSET